MPQAKQIDSRSLGWPSSYPPGISAYRLRTTPWVSMGSSPGEASFYRTFVSGKLTPMFVFFGRNSFDLNVDESGERQTLLAMKTTQAGTAGGGPTRRPPSYVSP